MDMSSHPAAAADADNPRERIVAALRQRANAAPPATPNLPALITALPGDATRAPQTEFDRARQVMFLENLSVTGSVSSAAAAGGVSRQSAYRARRATAAFRIAWDAALVVARVSVADTVGCRAIDGITEPVFYHGEEVGSRTRYSDRLLLAHLARLDKLAETPSASAFAEDWDAALARFGAGEDGVARQPEPTPPSPSPPPENLFPEPCNTCSKSNTPDHEKPEDVLGDWDDIDWEDEAAAEAEVERIEAAMAADRPADAPRLDADDPGGEIADAQWQAFEAGVPRWWLVVPPAPYGGEGEWHYADVTDADANGSAEDDGDDSEDDEDVAPVEDEVEDDAVDNDADEEDGAVSPAGIEVEARPQPTQ